MRVSPVFSASVDKAMLSGGDTSASGNADEGSRQSSSSHNGADSFGELDGPLVQSGELECTFCRKPFRQPRLLMCLHAFCEECVVALLERSQSNGSQSRSSSVSQHGGGSKSTNLLECELESSTEHDVAQPPPGVVRCPVCKQDSQIGNDLRFVQSLQPDYITMNLQDASALERMQLVCESCKTKEKAVARCVDCANVLCPNCVQAHKFMRCFENHKVMTFDEIKNSEEGMVLHKPIFCMSHPTEHVRLFCATCRIPVCNECLLSTHKFVDHNYLKPSQETEAAAKDRLKNLLAKGQSKILRCNNENQEIETKLNDLQTSVDEARLSVEYAFEKYQTMLNNRREKLLTDLTQLQNQLETKIMHTAQQIDNTSEKIRDAIHFTERLLKYGDAMEIMCTMSVVEAQLLQVIHSVPSAQFAVKVNFLNDDNLFEQSLLKSAGYFYADLEHKPPEPSLAADQLLLTPTSRYASQAVSANPLTNGHSSASLFDPYISTLDQSLTSRMAAATPFIPQSTNSNTSNMFNVSSAPLLNGPFMGGATSFADGSHAPNLTPSYLTGRASVMHGLSPTGAVATMTSSSGGGGGASSWLLDAQQQAIERALGGLTLSMTSSAASGGVGCALTSMHPAGASASSSALTPSSAISVGVNNLGVVESGWTLPPALTPPSDSGSSGGGALQAVGGPYSQNFLGVDLARGGCGLGISGLNPPIRHGQMLSMTIKSKIGSLGPTVGQFNSPHGFCLSPTGHIVVADTNNHRIQIFDVNGEFKGQFGVPGKEEGQLWYPRKVAILRNSGKFIVCDRGNERSRMQLFTRQGVFVKKIAIRYIDIVAGLCVDQEGHVVAVDSVSPTVFCIDESGELVHWFDCSNYMKEPSDIAAFDREYFICDFKGHCVCVFDQRGKFLRKIGCEGITNFPNGIDISDAGDVLVGDSHGNRFHVALFKRSGELQVEYECPYVKVSRCCGLRITNDGLIITIAKNNHNVLILDTLYVG